LQKSSWLERKSVIYKIRHESHKQKKVREVIDYVKSSGGIGYAENIMNSFYEEAMKILSEFPDSPFRKSLGDLVKFTIDRTR
jgi:octaprenyl-diphosphate synthase